MNIETYTLNGEFSEAIVYRNQDIESTVVKFSENELITWIEENEYNEVLDRDQLVLVDAYQVIDNALVLNFLNR